MIKNLNHKVNDIFNNNTIFNNKSLINAKIYGIKQKIFTIII